MSSFWMQHIVEYFFSLNILTPIPVPIIIYNPEFNPFNVPKTAALKITGTFKTFLKSPQIL